MNTTGEFTYPEITSGFADPTDPRWLRQGRIECANRRVLNPPRIPLIESPLWIGLAMSLGICGVASAACSMIMGKVTAFGIVAVVANVAVIVVGSLALLLVWFRSSIAGRKFLALRRQRQEIIDAARALCERTDKAGKPMNDSETQEFEGYMKDADDLTKRHGL